MHVWETLQLYATYSCIKFTQLIHQQRGSKNLCACLIVNQTLDAAAIETKRTAYDSIYN